MHRCGLNVNLYKSIYYEHYKFLHTYRKRHLGTVIDIHVDIIGGKEIQRNTFTDSLRSNS